MQFITSTLTTLLILTGCGAAQTPQSSLKGFTATAERILLEIDPKKCLVKQKVSCLTKAKELGVEISASAPVPMQEGTLIYKATASTKQQDELSKLVGVVGVWPDSTPVLD